jgi:hypothetical protein
MIFRPATAIVRVCDPQTGEVHVLIFTKPDALFATQIQPPQYAAATDLRTGELWLVQPTILPGVDLEGFESTIPVELLDSGTEWTAHR